MINTKTLSEQTYSELYGMIMNRKFSPGEKVTEEKVANILGVSRTTVKKAFTTLVKEGVLEDIPRKGVFLKIYSKKEIQELYDLREVTAGLSARYAALNMTRRDLNFLESVYKKMELAVENHDNAAYVQYDLEFHEAIVKIGGSTILSDIISNFNLRLNPINIVGIRNSEETIVEHRNIIDSLKRGKLEDAENIMRKHISRGKDVL